MANYATLKAAINAVITANGNKEITGTVLNETLTAIVNSLGANYQFAGVATPSTNPGTPDQNVFYLAGQAGTYTNFNGIVLPDGVSVLMWNGSWSSQAVLIGDGGVFDLSAYNAVGGVLATYADLSAALTALNALPAAYKRGGMSFKYVQTSDNKYVQYRLMAQTFGTTVANWQGLDEKPTAISNNMVESSGVFDALYNGVYYGKYVYGNGTLKNDNDWFVVEYKLDEPIKQNDVIQWNGITYNPDVCIGFYLDGVFKNARSATGDSRTISITSAEDAAIGSNIIKASFLISKKNVASIQINNTKPSVNNTPKYLANILDDILKDDSSNPVKNSVIYKAIQAVISSQAAEIDLSQIALERGTISTYGDDYPNNVAIRTPNNAKIEVSHELIFANGIINAVLEYVPNAASINMNIHCYDASGVSLGRTSAGWQSISKIGYVYQLLPNTKYIRIVFNFSTNVPQEITLSNEQVVSIIANVNSIIYVASYDESLYALRDSIRGIASEVYDITNPSIPSQYGYVGAPINLKSGGNFDASEYMTIWGATGVTSGQGCINWNEKLLVGGAGGKIRVYNLNSKSELGDVTLACASAENHVNNLSWGAEGDANNLEFPKYLYISEVTEESRCFVENFALQDSSLIQTIKYVDGGTHFLGGFQWVVDNENGYLYVTGQTTINVDSPDCKVGIKKFALPKISEGATIELTDSDVIASWEYDGTRKYMYISQGIYYYKGKLYFCTGGYDNGQHTMPHRLFVIDLLNCDVISMIDLAKVYEAEAEACCVYNDQLLVCYPNQGKLYALSF